MTIISAGIQGTGEATLQVRARAAQTQMPAEPEIKAHLNHSQQMPGCRGTATLPVLWTEAHGAGVGGSMGGAGDCGYKMGDGDKTCHPETSLCPADYFKPKTIKAQQTQEETDLPPTA